MCKIITIQPFEIRMTIILELILLLLCTCIASGPFKRNSTDGTGALLLFKEDICSHNRSLHCPVWADCDNQNGICKCLEKISYIFQCDPYGKMNYIRSCYCLTYNEESHKAEVGLCLYNCYYFGKSKYNIEEEYSLLSNDVDDWNEATCGIYNRTGTLCGQCVNNTYLPAYSYDMTCRSCGSTLTSLITYIAVAYGFLTLFCFLVVATRLNVTSSPLLGYVFVCQTLTCPVFARVILSFLRSFKEMSWYRIGAQVLGAILGVWNLDYFRWFDLNICFEVDSLTILSLDFFVALYPLVLMVIIYWIICLYDSNYRLIVVLVFPIKSLFLFFKKNWNIKLSIIDAFATFVFLSNVKFLNVCYDLLVPVEICDPSINGTCVLALFNNATTLYFSHSHTPYAVLALLVFLLFVILPLVVLLLYPFKYFQAVLKFIPQRWQLALLSFVDSFQGCYKDGTVPGCRDYRWFSAMPFILRLIIFCLYAINGSLIIISYCIIVLVASVLIVIIVEPHKTQFQHYSDHFVVCVLLLCGCITCSVLTIFLAVVFYVVFFFLFCVYLSVLVYLYIRHVYC